MDWIENSDTARINFPKKINFSKDGNFWPEFLIVQFQLTDERFKLTDLMKIEGKFFLQALERSTSPARSLELEYW